MLFRSSSLKLAEPIEYLDNQHQSQPESVSERQPKPLQVTVTVAVAFPNALALAQSVTQQIAPPGHHLPDGRDPAA